MAVRAVAITNFSRHFQVVYVSIWLVLFQLTCSTYAAAQQLLQKNEKDIYSVYDICDAYYAFLSMSEVDGTDGCDEVSSFLVSQRNEENILKTLSIYSGKLEGKTPFDILLQGVRATNLGQRGNAFWILDFSGKQLFRAYTVGESSDRDYLRGGVYSTLIDRYKLILLTAELPGTSEIIDTFQFDSFAGIGAEFEVMDRRPGSNVLLCLLVSDNQRVPLDVVVSSEFFKNCLSKNAALEED